MTIDEQERFLREQAADCIEAADMAEGIASIQQAERERAARLIACANTIAAERARREAIGADWE